MSTALLTARVDRYWFGAPVTAVTEILARPAVTRIPRVAESVVGVAVVRGQALAVLSLRPMVGVPPTEVALALRWPTARGVVLVAVDQVESLWVAEHPVPAERWADLVPPAMRSWITGGYRFGEEWLWEWPEDLPDRIQEQMLGGIRHGG